VNRFYSQPLKRLNIKSFKIGGQWRPHSGAHMFDESFLATLNAPRTNNINTHILYAAWGNWSGVKTQENENMPCCFEINGEGLLNTFASAAFITNKLRNFIWNTQTHAFAAHFPIGQQLFTLSISVQRSLGAMREGGFWVVCTNTTLWFAWKRFRLYLLVHTKNVSAPTHVRYKGPKSLKQAPLSTSSGNVL